MRSLEDTIYTPVGFRADRSVMGTRQDTMQTRYATEVFPSVKILESMSTQPESLILAQSERWRQA